MNRPRPPARPLLAPLLAMLLMLLPALLLGCGDPDDPADPAAPPPGAVSFTLTAAGGTFTGAGPLAGVVLTVPPGATPVPIDGWMAPPPTARPLPAGGHLVGPEVLFGPDPLSLTHPATLELPFDPAAAAAHGASLEAVKIWRIGPYGWEITPPLASATARGAEGRVRVETDDLSRFGAGVELP